MNADGLVQANGHIYEEEKQIIMDPHNKPLPLIFLITHDEMLKTQKKRER